MAPKFPLFTERNVVIFKRLHDEEIKYWEKQPSCDQPSKCEKYVSLTLRFIYVQRPIYAQRPIKRTLANSVDPKQTS